MSVPQARSHNCGARRNNNNNKNNNNNNNNNNNSNNNNNNNNNNKNFKTRRSKRNWLKRQKKRARKKARSRQRLKHTRNSGGAKTVFDKWIREESDTINAANTAARSDNIGKWRDEDAEWRSSANLNMIFHPTCTTLPGQRDHKEYFDPILQATLGGDARTLADVLFDSGYIHEGGNIVRADVVDRWRRYDPHGKWLKNFEDFRGKTRAVQKARGFSITVADKRPMHSVGRVQVVLQFRCELNGTYDLPVLLHIFEELSQDIIISNKTMAAMAENFLMDHKGKAIHFLDETQKGEFKSKAILPAPRSSWRKLPELTAMRFHFRKRHELFTTEDITVAEDEKFYAQVALPGKICNLNYCGSGTGDVEPHLLIPDGDIDDDQDGMYYITSTEDIPGAMDYAVQGHGTMAVRLEMGAPQLFSITNKTGMPHTIPKGTPVCCIETEASYLNLQTDEEGTFVVNLNSMMGGAVPEPDTGADAAQKSPHEKKETEPPASQQRDGKQAGARQRISALPNPGVSGAHPPGGPPWCRGNR